MRASLRPLALLLAATTLAKTWGGSCAPTIPGLWTCATCKGAAPSSYYWANRTTVFDTSATSSWRVGRTAIAADNVSLAAAYDNGRNTTGAISADCYAVSFSDKSRWEFAGARPAAPLRVHVAPHSHDDVGWNEAYLEYYAGTGPLTGRNVTRILTAVVAGLLANPQRRFSYVEQAFFALFFEAASPPLQDTLRSLVAGGRLVFLGGGWSMHDEANPTYTCVVEGGAAAPACSRRAFFLLTRAHARARPFSVQGHAGQHRGGPPLHRGRLWRGR
jgi:hypothetical protein